MDIFASCLLASDYDQSLTVRGVLPPEAVSAIGDFRREGGIFTICTGRPPTFLDAFVPELLSDGYIITNNGNILQDLKQDRILRYCVMDTLLEEIFTVVLSQDISAFHRIAVYGLNQTWDFPLVFSPDAPDADLRHPLSLPYPPTAAAFAEKVPKPVCKALFVMDTEEHALHLRDVLRQRFAGRARVSRSWPVGVEICPIDGGKGFMSSKLKRHLKKDVLVCAGDFENDADMFEAADISYAPDTALEEIKDLADVVLPAGEHGIFPALIADLKTKL